MSDEMDDDQFAQMLKLSTVYIPILKSRCLFDDLREMDSSEEHNALNCLEIVADTFLEMQRRIGVKPKLESKPVPQYRETSMSDIVEDLMMRRADGTLFNPSGPTAADTITRLRADIINYKIGNKDLQDHCTEITSLTAEVEQNAIDLEEYRRDVEKLRAALEAICMMDISWVGDAFKLKDIARAALEET